MAMESPGRFRRMADNSPDPHWPCFWICSRIATWFLMTAVRSLTREMSMPKMQATNLRPSGLCKKAGCMADWSSRRLMSWESINKHTATHRLD
eukprot:1148923-Pelagomonas_calceolata.AAC.4